MTVLRRISAALFAAAIALATVVPALVPASATVQTTANKTIALGNGISTTFNFSFIGVAAAYITVIYTDASGNETVLTQGSGTTQYQISLNAPVTGAIWGVGGTLTYNPSGTPIASGTSLTIFRTLPLTQAISLQNQNSLARLGNGAETGLDTSVMQSQQISETIARAIKAPIVDATPPADLPPIAQRANHGAAFDALGNLVAGTTPASGIISSAMQPVVNAATLALGRTAFGLGNIAVENIGSGLQDDGLTNVRVNTTALTQVSTNQSVTSSFNNRSFISTGPISFNLAQASALWNGFSFTVYAFSGPIQIVPNGADNFPSLAGGAANTVPQNTVAEISTDGVNGWYLALMPRGLSAPQGYLTPCSASISVSGCTTGNLLPTSDVTGVSTLYYQTGPAGSHIPLYNGAIMMMLPFSELSLTLNANHLASTIYDVCVFNNGGVSTLVTAPAWQVSTAGSGARGTSAAIARTAGYWTNSQPITGRNGASTYSIAANACTIVGSILIDATPGQVSATPAYGQSRKWGVWNFYNRQQITLKVGDPTASWTYNSAAAARPSNNNAANSMTMFTGLPEEIGDFTFAQRTANAVGAGALVASISVGFNSTSTSSGMTASQAVSTSASSVSASPARYVSPRSLGANVITSLEVGNTNSPTFSGTETNMLLIGNWRG